MLPLFYTLALFGLLADAADSRCSECSRDPGHARYHRRRDDRWPPPPPPPPPPGRESMAQNFFYLDNEDLRKGLKFIPPEVTQARREGKYILLVQDCPNCCCWYWQFPNGSRFYYWERGNYESIARSNDKEFGEQFSGDAGSCRHCGNRHTSGGFVPVEEV